MCTVGSHICQPRCQLPDAWVVSPYTSCWPWLCLVCPGCVIYHIAWATLSSSLLEPATAVLVVARAKKFIILLLPREGAGCWSSESSDCFSASRSSIWWGGTTVNKSGTPERAQARPAVDPPVESVPPWVGTACSPAEPRKTPLVLPGLSSKLHKGNALNGPGP